MNGKKILITGGFGNLGSYIVKYLLAEGFQITILTRQIFFCQTNNYSVIECDITDLKQLKIKLNIDFDFCIHCAGFEDVSSKDFFRKSLMINSLGTRNLLEALNIKTLKNFVYISTFHVYGLYEGLVEENSPTNPKNDYATTHLFAEYYIKQFGYTHNLKFTILRLTNSFGSPIFPSKDKWKLVLKDIVKNAFNKNEIILSSNGKAKRDFIGMNDVSHIIRKILDKEATNDVYNLSSNKTIEIIQIAKLVQRIFKIRYCKEIGFSYNINDKSDYLNFTVSNIKIKNFIQFDISDSFEDEIIKMLDSLEQLENETKI
jgi:UDP-glucose 4-epimerase